MVSPIHLAVVIPIYNDWESAYVVCRELGAQLAADSQVKASIVLVDDGSNTAPVPDRFDSVHSSIVATNVLTLTRNLGHQRAIAVALAFIRDSMPVDTVLVMDGDGEDRPEDVVRLLQAYREHGQSSVVFAARRKRLESWIFRAGYSSYRVLHWLLTGISVRVGNFSIIPARYVTSLAASSDLWSHYAAAVVHARIPYVLVTTERGKRLAGQSHMNYPALVSHGLGAIAVFREIVGARLLFASSVLCGIVFAGVAIIAAIRLSGSAVLPGWADLAMGLSLVMALQLMIGAFVLAFVILANRDNGGFIPARDYKFFVQSFKTLRESQPPQVRGVRA